METMYITIPIHKKKDRERQKRLETVVALAQAAVGVVCFVGIVAILVHAAYEPVPVAGDAAATVLPMEVYTTSDVGLLADEDQNPATTPQNLANPSPLTDEEWDVLCEVCEERSIDVSLALGLIWVESRFDPNAVSKSGCYGYTQLHPQWHPSGLPPEENIRYGINYLANQCERYDNIESGLTAYNAGRDTGNRRYANAVLAAAKEWEARLNDSNS